MNKVVMLLSNPFRPDPRVLKEAVSLAEAGYDLTILAWDRTNTYSPVEQISPNLKVVRIQDVQSGFGLGSKQISRIIKFWQSSLPYLNSIHPNLIHCHDFDTLPIGVIFAKRAGIPVIYDAHEHYAEFVRPRLRGTTGNLLYKIIDRAEKYFSKRVDAIITVDDYLAAKYHLLNSRVYIIGHYPSKEFFQTNREIFTKPEINLIYNGRLSQDRGVLHYLEIVQQLKNQTLPVFLILAGEFSPLTEKVAAMQKMIGMENQVKIMEWTSYFKIPDLLRISDVGLAIYQPLPRYVNALPVKIFEYMAAGLPVIASDFPANRSLLDECECGFLVPPHDVHLATEVIQSWIENPGEARLFGERGKLAIREKYNWESLVGVLVDLYNGLV